MSDDRCVLLRRELKQWETSFAAANDGRKASREEIKRDGAIAKKYKEYNQLRAESNSTTSPRKKTSKAPCSPSRNARPADPHSSMTTPPKRRNHTSTPQKRKHTHHDSGIELAGAEDLASLEADEKGENASPVVKRLFVDPTPQKNGRVLGLFDLLSPVKEQISVTKNGVSSGNLFDSSSKVRVALVDVSGNAMPPPLLTFTPRKRSLQESLEVQDNTADLMSPSKRHSRTPQSTSKQYLLDTFITPSKRRRLCASNHGTPSHSTIPAPADGTPAFLRRDSQRFPAAFDDIAEEDLEDDDGDGFDMARLSGGAPGSPSRKPRPRALPGLTRSNTAPSLRRPGFGTTAVGRAGMLRRSGSVRTLSSMIAEMRKTEDDRLDEEMDMLREMEGAGADEGEEVVRWSKKNVPVTEKEKKKEATKKAKKAAEKQLLVEDSQIPRFEDDISHEALGPDGAYAASEDQEGGDDGSKRRDGGERRLWKKRGAKRQTRKVIMRPRGRALKLGEEEQDVPPEVENEMEQEVVAVEETQFVADDAFETDDFGGIFTLGNTAEVEADDAVDVTLTEEERDARAQAAMLANLASDDDDDEEMVLAFDIGEDAQEGEEYLDAEAADVSDGDNVSDGDVESTHRASRAQKPARPPLSKAASSSRAHPPTTGSKDPGIAESKPSTIARADRKVAATANANFCRLKIRGAKGAAGAKTKANARRFGKGGGRR